MTPSVSLGLVTLGLDLAAGPGSTEVSIAEVAVRYVNDVLGGVAGLELRLEVVSELADPELARDGAEELVDKGVCGVFGLGLEFAEHGLPILEEAGVPWFGAPIAPRDYVSPVSFPIIGGVPAELGAIAEYFVSDRGRSRIVLVLPGVGGAAGVHLIMQSECRRRGIADVHLVEVALDADDLRPVAAGIRDHAPDLVVGFLGGAQASALMGEFANERGNVGLVFGGTAMDDGVFAAAGDAATGTFHCAEFLPYDHPTDPEVRVFAAALKRDCALSPTNWAQGTFSSVVTASSLLGSVARGEELSSSTLLSAFATVEDHHVFMGSSLSRRSTPRDYPQLINTGCLILERTPTGLSDVGDGWINGLDCQEESV